MEHPPSIVDNAAWVTARLELLEEEKAMSKAIEALAAKRRQLPWTAVKEDYTLIDSTSTPVKLSDLFQDDSSELIVYHMMFGETFEKACSMCSFFVDQYNGVNVHLAPRAKLVVVCNKEYQALATLKEEKNWQLQLLSSKDTMFNQDMNVSFSAAQVESKDCAYNFNRTWSYGSEAPGMSVFRRRNGSVYRTYSTYAAGLGNLSLVHSLLDITSTGRNECGQRPMWWVQHKEEYVVAASSSADITLPAEKKLKTDTDTSANTNTTASL